MKTSQNFYNPEIDCFDYDELVKLRNEIDELLDCTEDEEIHQQRVRTRIKGISIDLGIHRDFLAEKH